MDPVRLFDRRSVESFNSFPDAVQCIGEHAHKAAASIVEPEQFVNFQNSLFVVAAHVLRFHEIIAKPQLIK